MNLRLHSPSWSLTGVFLALAALTSCQRADVGGNAQADAAGAIYLLNEEPPGARGVLDIRADLEASETPEAPVDVTLVAHVGGVEGLTWDPARAAFLVLDLASVENAEPQEEHQHDADNCPFCRAKKKKLLASTALVQIVDPEGNVPAMDARKLLGLKEGQTVVVRGAAKIDALGNLAVRAAGIYVRPAVAGTTS